jgi:hypothetical protein
MGRITTLLEVIGLASIATGVGWIYPPAGLICVGAELVTVSVFATRPPKATR